MACMTWQLATPEETLAANCPTCYIDLCQSPCGIEFGADVLWWSTCQMNMDYSYNETLPLPDDPPPPFLDLLAGKGNIHFIDYTWHTGVRYFLTYRAGCDQWDGRIIFTHYHTRGDEEANLVINDPDALLQDPPRNNFAALLHPDTTVIPDETGFDKGKAHNEIDYDVLDILFSRTFCCINQSLLINPYLGLRLLYLDQDLEADYKVVEEDDEEDSPVINRSCVSFDSEFKGIGFHTGVELTHHLIGNFELYGNVSGSLIAGTMRNDHVQEDDGTITVDLKEKQNHILPGLQLGIGVVWNTPFICSTFFETKIGYEFTSWYHTPQIRRFIKQDTGVMSSSTNGNIGFHGATFRFALNY